MRIDVFTIFPEYLAPLDLSLIGKARREGLLDVAVHDLRAFTHDRHNTVDDTPYGGGAGMVMKPQPWSEALTYATSLAPGTPHLLVPAPSGRPFTQPFARALATEPWLAFACGRYEGIDERVYDFAAADLGWQVTPVSLGDYVLNGGEVAVLAIIEAVVRLLPGVVGNADSLVEESHEGGLLEYPVYTKPARWTPSAPAHPGAEAPYEVPEVLLSGNHAAIADWRHRQRLERTAERRPDLLPASATVTGLDDLVAAPATPADLPELLVLTRACWVPEAIAAGTAQFPPMTDGPAEHAQALRDWTTWVWRCGGRLVASGRGRRDPDDPSVWQVGRLMVAPDLAGRGLGRAVLAFIESLAPAGVTSYWINTGRRSERNQRIYRKAGYRLAPWESAVHPETVDLVKRRR
ncbi:MAG: tRNA (guanosine(37)-N1)-methyltransferase TrmD [Dermatophilaceae bacterium]